MKNLLSHWRVVLFHLSVLLISAVLITNTVQAHPVSQPGNAPPAASVPLAGPVAGGPGFVSLSGLSFEPTSPTCVSYSFTGGALVNNGPGCNFRAQVLIPNGATITKMVIYYMDEEPDIADSMVSSLSSYALANGTATLMAGFVDTGSQPGPTYREITSISEPTVDLSYYTYFVTVFMPWSSNVVLYGVRIDYGFNLTLPLVVK